MKTKALLERREKAVPRGVTNITSIFADSAKSATITDVEGREYIDFASGIGVNNVGHCHPKVVAAIREQAGQTPPFLLSRRPIRGLRGPGGKTQQALTPGDFKKKTVLLNSGAEAVENAVKIARHATGRPAIIASGSGFHGRTLLAASLTAKVMPYKAGFGPFAPEIYRIPFAYCYRCPVGCSYPNCNMACADLLKKRFVDLVDPASVAAVILEPVAGEGGFLSSPQGVLPAHQGNLRRIRHPADHRRSPDRHLPYRHHVRHRTMGCDSRPVDLGQVPGRRYAHLRSHRPR